MPQEAQLLLLVPGPRAVSCVQVASASLRTKHPTGRTKAAVNPGLPRPKTHQVKHILDGVHHPVWPIHLLHGGWGVGSSGMRQEAWFHFHLRLGLGLTTCSYFCQGGAWGVGWGGQHTVISRRLSLSQMHKGLSFIIRITSDF